MNRRAPANGSKKANKLSVRKNRDDCDSNSTDSFDMNEFKTTSLNKKYSVPIHKNKADLMAELNNINIMGDESDGELLEPMRTERIALNTCVSVSERNSSKNTSRSLLNTTNSSGDSQLNGELADVKQERILAWAQSQSQNLSMCVASILSDHDYLSQEHLIGIVTGNEENTEIGINSQKQRDHVNSNNDLSKEQTIDSQATIIYENERNGNTTQTFPPNDIDSLSVMLNKLKQSKEQQHYLSLLDDILDKVNRLKMQMHENQESNKIDESKVTAPIDSNETPDFSPNHSEPMEYDGGIRFSAQSSVDDTKDSEGDEKIVEMKTELKTVRDIANRIAVDTKSITSRLANIETQPESERNDAIGKLRENFGLLVEDMANELTKIAVKFNPKAKLTGNDSSHQKSDGKNERSRLMSDSTDEFDYQAKRSARRLKRRRKVQRSTASVSGSSDLSSHSDDVAMAKDKPIIPKDEPFVVSQNIDDLMNGGASNSANESLTKENDLLGFDNDDVEIGIKTEVMLNSETPNSASNNTTNQKMSQMDTNTSKDKSVVNSENTNNLSAIQEMDRPSSSTGLSDNFAGDEDDEEEEEDEAIRKLCDLSTIVAKRIPLSNANAIARSNGVIDPKKPVKKASKEDELAKFLANSDDTEPSKIESEDEKSIHEEYTEEQYLMEQNEKLKMQLLEDSSDSEQNYDDSDDDRKMNGKGSDSNNSDDDKPTSDSDGSILEQFLRDESKGDGNKSPKHSETPNKEHPNEKKKAEDDEEEMSEPKTKELASKKRPIKIDRFEVSTSDSDIEFDDEGSISLSEAPQRKTMSTVGKNVFRSLEKEPHIILPSDDEDMSGSETVKKPAKKPNSEASSSGNNSEILDTSMFKGAKKDFNPQQLSRILQTNRSKQPTSRISPECISVSSDDDIEMESTSADKKDENEDDEEEKEKRVTRKLLRPDQLTADTKIAQKEEQERIKRLDKKNERLTQFISDSQKLSQDDTESEEVDPNEVILDISKKNEKIEVHREITKHLKPHQVEGIKFMYDCCYGSVDNLDKFPGSGCILAHCMGLGKTLQLITLLV